MLVAAHFTNKTLQSGPVRDVEPFVVYMILYRAWVTEIIVSATLYTNEKTLTFYATALLWLRWGLEAEAPEGTFKKCSVSMCLQFYFSLTFFSWLLNGKLVWVRFWACGVPRIIVFALIRAITAIFLKAPAYLHRWVTMEQWVIFGGWQQSNSSIVWHQRPPWAHQNLQFYTFWGLFSIYHIRQTARSLSVQCMVTNKIHQNPTNMRTTFSCSLCFPSLIWATLLQLLTSDVHALVATSIAAGYLGCCAQWCGTAEAWSLPFFDQSTAVTEPCPLQVDNSFAYFKQLP